MDLVEHSENREKLWLEKYGHHQYELCDFFNEAKEELADCWNYIRHSDLEEDKKDIILILLSEIYNIL